MLVSSTEVVYLERRKHTIGIKQHMSILPTVAQMLLKSSMLVGTVGAIKR